MVQDSGNRICRIKILTTCNGRRRKRFRATKFYNLAKCKQQVASFLSRSILSLYRAGISQGTPRCQTSRLYVGLRVKPHALLGLSEILQWKHSKTSRASWSDSETSLIPLSRNETSAPLHLIVTHHTHLALCVVELKHGVIFVLFIPCIAVDQHKIPDQQMHCSSFIWIS